MRKRSRFLSRVWPVFAAAAACALLCLYWQWLEHRDGPAADLAVSLDARVPFQYGFAAFYLAWFVIAAVVLLILFVKSRTDCLRLALELAGGALLFLLISALYPNTADIRPEVNAGASILARAVTVIYAYDTPRNVLPGFHPFMVIAVTHACRRARGCRRLRAMYPLILLMAVPGAASAFLIKQLPVVSVPACAAMAAVMNPLVWRLRADDFTFARL